MTTANSDSGTDIPETHNYTEAVGTRLTPKTKRRLEAYEEREEAGTSEALRRLVRAGLDAEDPEGWYDRAGRTAVLGLLMGYPTLAATQGDTTIATAWIIAMLLFSLFEPFITAAISRVPNPISWLK